MEHQFSRVITKKLKFLNLTLAGKIKLSIFTDKILYKAMDKFQRTEAKKSAITNPFAKFYLLCLQESIRLQFGPNFEKEKQLLELYPSAADAAMTENNEMFEVPNKCADAHNSLQGGMIKGINSVPQAVYAKGRPTFNQGIRYYKHGKWYAYPDQAISKDSRPCQPKDCNPACGACVPHEPIDRTNINPKKEFIKAINSGKINMKGLAFLRKSFPHKPEVLELIDDALERQQHIDDKQSNIDEETG